MTAGRIVVGIDGSPGARSALSWAAQEARLHGCELVVLHAAKAAERVATAGAEILDRAVRFVLDHGPDTRVVPQLCSGPAADVLVERSRDAELVVLGTRGSGGITTSILGSVSYRVAVHALCPVAVVPERLAPQRSAGGGLIVVGAASSTAGRAAMQLAVREARCRGARVHVLFARADDGDGEEGAGEAARLRMLDKEVVELRRRTEDVPVELVAVDEEPATALIQAADRADLIVLGCHHSGDRWGTRLGPIPSAVVHQVTCPVILVGRPA